VAGSTVAAKVELEGVAVGPPGLAVGDEGPTIHHQPVSPRPRARRTPTNSRDSSPPPGAPGAGEAWTRPAGRGRRRGPERRSALCGREPRGLLGWVCRRRWGREGRRPTWVWRRPPARRAVARSGCRATRRECQGVAGAACWATCLLGLTPPDGWVPSRPAPRKCGCAAAPGSPWWSRWASAWCALQQLLHAVLSQRRPAEPRSPPASAGTGKSHSCGCLVPA